MDQYYSFLWLPLPHSMGFKAEPSLWNALPQNLARSRPEVKEGGGSLFLLVPGPSQVASRIGWEVLGTACAASRKTK